MGRPDRTPPPQYRTIVEDGYEILVGKAASDNDALTFRVARPNDMWLHASGYAGSHVVVRRAEDGEEIPRTVLERAAELAAFHSKAREARGKVTVSVCRASDVRKERGAPAGQVQLRRSMTMKVYPRE